MSSSRTAIWVRSPVWRTAITRSTASRRARNSASVRIGARRRPVSRLSRRRWRLASSLVEPLTPRTPSSSARAAPAFGPRPATVSRRAPRCWAGRPRTARLGTVRAAGPPAPAAAPGTGRQGRLGDLVGVVLGSSSSSSSESAAAASASRLGGRSADRLPRPRRPRRRRRRVPSPVSDSSRRRSSADSSASGRSASSVGGVELVDVLRLEVGVEVVRFEVGEIGHLLGRARVRLDGRSSGGLLGAVAGAVRARRPAAGTAPPGRSVPARPTVPRWSQSRRPVGRRLIGGCSAAAFAALLTRLRGAFLAGAGSVTGGGSATGS